jgi:hypothetical protein
MTVPIQIIGISTTFPPKKAIQNGIQTIRDSLEDGDATPYSADDEPFDEEFGKPYFGLYGVGEDGKLEYIVDRRTYSEILSLVQKLAPGVMFPAAPIFTKSKITNMAKD